jgi:prophage regulatory protein
MDPNQEPPDRLIGERECRQITGLSRAHRWRLERKRKFPLRLSIGPQTVRWRLSEVMAWMSGLPPVEDLLEAPKPANIRPQAPGWRDKARVSRRSKREAEAAAP